MPKRRSNTISTESNSGTGAIGASGSGMSPGVINDLASRVNNRLSESIVVEGDSRSRGRNEEIRVTYNEEDERYIVDSASNRRYFVSNDVDSCTCPDFQNRNRTCRHMNAVNNAIGQAEQEIRDIEANEVMRARMQQDIRDEIQRNQEGPSTDDGFFYSDNLDTFDTTYENINDDLINYEYENVLNGNTSTFGVELEFVGGNADAIASELYDLGITAAPYRLGYHARVSDNSKWKLERDGSVSSGSQGGELVSPILKDTPETWRQIQAICEVAKRHGARINQSCGGHVHIGMNKLDTARQRWRRFFKIVENYEECLYKAAGGDLGRIRSNASNYATSFSERAAEANRMAFRLENDEDVREMAQRVSRMNRYYGINLKNIATDRAPTVEFRYFNGSLNPKQIQANIKLAAGIINASEKARWRDTEDENYKKRGKILKDARTSSGTRTKEKIIELLDIAFSRKRDKDMILNVFKKNEWR